MHLVSVIIPVYNGKNYIGRGLQSIIEQTYHNIEVIIIDDGSTDNSGKFIHDLIGSFGNANVIFKLFMQQNCGIAMTRNRGLAEASGEYIMFMDQDDWLESDCVENLVDELEKTDSDLVIGGFKLVDSYNRVEEVWNLNGSYEWSKFRITAPWGRIFRKAVIEKNDLWFMNTQISEDLYFNLLFMSYTSKIRVVSYVGYNWFHNIHSESRTRWNVMSAERNPLVMLDELHRKMKKPNSLREDILTYFFVKYIMWYLLYSAKGSPRETYSSMYIQCMQWLTDNYPNWNRINMCKWKNPGGEDLKTHMIVAGCVWLYKLKLLYPVLRMYNRF